MNLNSLIYILVVISIGCKVTNQTCQKNESNFESVEQEKFWELSHHSEWDEKLPKILEYTRDYIDSIPSSENCFLFKFDPIPLITEDTIGYIGIELYDKRKTVKVKGIDGKLYFRYNHIETLYFHPVTYKYKTTYTSFDTKKELRRSDKLMKKYIKKKENFSQ